VPGHYTTVRDLAAFTRYALQYPRFVDLISSASYTLHDGREIYNNNRMLNWYADLVGGKTGYDDDAGWCLVEVAERDGNTMISVTFDGIHEGEDWYDDNRALLEYAFEKKAERVAEGRDVTGVLVSYKDPDAAVVERIATSGASVADLTMSGDSGPAAVPLAGGAGGDQSSEPLAGSAAIPGLVGRSGPEATGRAAVAIAGVVALILFSRAMGTFSQPGGRVGPPSVERNRPRTARRLKNRVV
jgi:D-alanyl-D-alanine carboxypeptidase